MFHLSPTALYTPGYLLHAIHNRHQETLTGEVLPKHIEQKLKGDTDQEETHNPRERVQSRHPQYSGNRACVVHGTPGHEYHCEYTDRDRQVTGYVT